MKAVPIPCVFDNDAFCPLPAFRRKARDAYGDGEVVVLAPIEERSRASHNHYFSCVHEVWSNLREDETERFPTPDHLRRYALIKTGYRNDAQIVCSSQAEAVRAAIVARSLDPYCIAVPREGVLIVLTAKSQSLKAMGAQEFKASKEAVLTFLASMINVAPDSLSRRGKEAA